MALRIKEPKLWDFDYDGGCRPMGDGPHWNQTFSVGIFQWVPTANSKDIKRSRAVKRISGSSSNPQEVYARAEDWIRLNAQSVSLEEAMNE
jgi:hypothetical protein